jgi:uncharacterized protein YutD
VDRKSIEELVDEKIANQKPLAHIKRDADDILINGHTYEIIGNQNDCFNFNDFVHRYNPILSHYSYIVGDYGYGQLRLKGFFDDGMKSPLQNQFMAIQDYLYEYANMGADYFILHNLEVNTKIKKEPPFKHKKNKRLNKHNGLGKKDHNANKHRRRNTRSIKKRNFTIKQKQN